MLNFIISTIAILIAALPLKNWLEIRWVKKQDFEWSDWLSKKPSREDYSKTNSQKNDNIKCNFCESTRHFPRLEKKIPYKPKFGIINNQFEKYSYFRTIICSGCGSQIYRERYEK